MAEACFLSPGSDPTSQDACCVSVDFSPSCLLTFAPSSPSVNGMSLGVQGAPDHRYVSCLSRAVAHASQRQMPAVPCPSGQGKHGLEHGQRELCVSSWLRVWVAALSSFLTIFTLKDSLLSTAPALPRAT